MGGDGFCRVGVKWQRGKLTVECCARVDYELGACFSGAG